MTLDAGGEFNVGADDGEGFALTDESGALLADPTRLAAMGLMARAHALATHGLRSSEPACETLLRLARGDA